MIRPPRNCPAAYAPISTGKVISCQPRPAKMRTRMTSGTGRGIARNQGSDSRLTLLLQKPKGRLITKTSAPAASRAKTDFLFHHRRAIPSPPRSGVSVS